MIWSLLGAIAAAVCFGVASVMQAVAARSAPAGEGVDLRLLVRLVGQVPFVAGLGLDLLGFLAELVALRSLPLFVVQAAVAANLAVTAVVAARVLHTRLSAREWIAVAAVCAGLAMLGLASGHENPAAVGLRFRFVLLGCVAVIGVAGIVVGRIRGEAGSVALGLVAGLGFGFVAIGARVLTSLSPLDLLRDPAAYVVASGGLVAFVFFATALQRGSVTTTTAAVVVAETVVPALIGVLLLGDRTRHGFEWVAVVGFLMAVAGALVLARFGEPATEPDLARAGEFS
ncbi:MAG: integral rane protein [Actinoallomurus sp.]|jgi:drug/metabolite transporter (DMT)-like permease|nr:integral rane protein [Actinoallomurus sp.]